MAMEMVVAWSGGIWWWEGLKFSAKKSFLCHSQICTTVIGWSPEKVPLIFEFRNLLCCLIILKATSQTPLITLHLSAPFRKHCFHDE
jgi:hypothetical protein